MSVGHGPIRPMIGAAACLSLLQWIETHGLVLDGLRTAQRVLRGGSARSWQEGA
eukprot:SAG11_NODE_31058_length_295_cov_0.795918_1_plen_53_part_01